MKKVLSLFIVLLLILGVNSELVIAQQTTTSPTSVNGWEVLPLYDVYGIWFFDKEKTNSQLGAGYQTYNVCGTTRFDGGKNYIKADNLKNFFIILSADKRIIKKYIGFRYRISKLVGNVSEVMIRLGVQDNVIYVSNINLEEQVKNPTTDGWKEVKFETKAITNRLTSFYQLRFETWAVSTQAGYIGVSFDVDVLFGEDSLGVRTIYDAFDITSVPKETDQIPKEFTLSQNYPNPFNPTTKIQYFVPIESGPVTLKVYDLLGREVATLVDNEQKLAGIYEVNFDAGKFASGTYYYRLSTSNGINLSNKMMLMK